MSPIMRYFQFEHLPQGRAREVSKTFCAVAEILDIELRDGPEKSAGRRKLLEAKDCFVRAALP